MTPLHKLYASAGEILAKARRDRDALIDAVATGDDARVRDEWFDFSVTAYHVLDWVRSFHPHLESVAYAALDASLALRTCRDVANSHKHFSLNVDAGAYRKFPPVVDELDYSMGAPVSVHASEGATSDWDAPAVTHLKVVYATGNRSRIEEVANEAIAAWEAFFAANGIAP